MGSDDRYDKEPKIPKLTKENHEKWFRNNKLKLKGKGIFYTIEVTKHAYAWIARHGAGTSTSTIVFVLTILDIAVPLSLGLSIPGPETLARFYNICLQPTTAIDDSKLRATKKTFAFIRHRRDRKHV
ncbi:hypothetical protein PtrM4_045840 [Pyrenophora tritici-repentis]|uniref:Uncharacterized protein n=1 Tax=Pyrenophora tritici-repentis TaxID=45151 RepID=A0A834VIH8_9PLEO|nr:hypothetical protein PtrM4_045840 [Pyrenophora tritici-repentis]